MRETLLVTIGLYDTDRAGIFDSSSKTIDTNNQKLKLKIMKKLFIAVLLTITVATSGFTTDDKRVNSRIMQNFNADYSEADNVKWSIKANYVKASFDVAGEKAEVFYSHNGESIGCSKKITLDNLPVNAKRTFAKKYADYTVKEAIRFDSDLETAYFISAENEKHAVILKITDAGISIFKKTNKS